jgi:hypothetical protein
MYKRTEKNRTIRVSSATAKARLPARRNSEINKSRDAPATAEMPATTWAFSVTITMEVHSLKNVSSLIVTLSLTFVWNNC